MTWSWPRHLGRAAEWVAVRPLRRTCAHTRGTHLANPQPRNHNPAGSSSPPIIGHRLPASSSFVLARALTGAHAAGADSTNLPGEGLPQGTLRALVLRGLNGDGVPGDGPWRPDAQEVVVP